MLLAACVAAALVMDRAIIWLASQQRPPIMITIASPSWPEGVPDWWSPPTQATLERSVFGTIEMTERIGAPGDPSRLSAIRIRSGFPFRSASCMWCSYSGPRRSLGDPKIVQGVHRPAAFESIWVRGIEMNRAYAPMPLKPILSGLFGNLVVWTIVFLLAWFAACLGVQRLTRRWRRARGNQCIGCGYDLTGLAAGVCPECGRGADSAARSE